MHWEIHISISYYVFTYSNLSNNYVGWNDCIGWQFFVLTIYRITYSFPKISTHAGWKIKKCYNVNCNYLSMRLFNEFSFQIKSKNTEDETQPQRDAIEEKRAEDGSAEVDNEDNKYREKKGTEKLSNGLAVVVLLFCFGIFGLVLLMDNRLPKPLTLAGNFICQVYLTLGRLLTIKSDFYQTN